MLLKTFKYRLYPTREQIQIINQTIETCRRLYNYFLEDRIYTFKEIKSGVSKVEQINQIPMALVGLMILINVGLVRTGMGLRLGMEKSE